MMGQIQESCVNARPNCKIHVFCWKYNYPRKRVQTHMFSFTNQKPWLEEAEAQVSKIKPNGLDLFLAEYLHDLQRLVPQEKVASPGQPSTDRTWWDKFKNFVSTRAQIAKHMFFVENTFVPAKGYRHICLASPTQKMSWKRSDPRFNMQARVIC